MSNHTITWACRELSNFLNTDISEDVVSYMMDINEEQELRDYVFDLVGDSSAKVQDFIEELLQRRSNKPDGMSVYKKPSIDDQNEINRSTKSKKRKEIKNLNLLSEIHGANSAKTPLDMLAKSTYYTDPLENLTTGMKKKKQQYVSLYSKEGENRSNAVKIPGRHACECQAQKHKLINNCLGCGRVVCAQENSGPCLFCGELVCTNDERMALDRDSNKSSKLYAKLISRGGGKELQTSEEAVAKATAYKNRLLEYDRSYAKRTQVIDDESDYYATNENVWLNEKERNLLKTKEKEIHEVRHGSRLNRKSKMTLDFAGRKVIEEDITIATNFDHVDQDVFNANFTSSQNDRESFNEIELKDHESIANPSLFVKSLSYEPTEILKANRKPNVISRNILQDRCYLEMSDQRKCLSMHQPWATLLIKGIKLHEGRTWYSSHRGRLWIAAAAHEVSDDEIANLQSFYIQMGRDISVDFPKSYPTACLLGCVNVTDVLAQEEYREKYPDGESNSPYVFICENPLELMIKFPIKGKHKIWLLPTDAHKAAKSNLRL